MFSIFLIELGDYIIISPLRAANGIFFPLSETKLLQSRRQGKGYIHL